VDVDRQSRQLHPYRREITLDESRRFCSSVIMAYQRPLRFGPVLLEL